MLPTVSFFMVFVLIIKTTKFDSTKSSNQILFVNILQILNIRYFRYYWIIKYIGFEPIIFVINMDTASSSKAFNIFYYMFFYRLYY